MTAPTPPELGSLVGVRVNGQRTVQFESSGPAPSAVTEWLAKALPWRLGGHEVIHVEAPVTTGGSAESSVAVSLHFRDARVVVQPSLTEAELTLHGECWRPVASTAPDHSSNRNSAHLQLGAILNELSSLVADPERNQAAAAMAATARSDDAGLQSRAEQLFAALPTHLSFVEALRLCVESIDLTTLAGDDTTGRVRALCAQARRPDPADPTVGPTAAVCVYPNLVPTAVELTAGSRVLVASVAGAFPSGLSSLEVRLSDIAEAVAAGADEIDVVLNRAALLSGRDDIVVDELTAMRQQIGTRVMKVILETSELRTAPAIRHASRLAMQAGADWIKTSTGKSATGATPIAVIAMAQAIADYHAQTGQTVGLKVSGGVRTSADALGYLSIVEATLGPEWLHPSRIRFGASGLLTAIVADLASAP